MYDNIFEALLRAMQPLAHVQQNPRYHPEGDALFHSLQTFDLAADAGDAPHVVAAALFHDVGKSLTGPHHERSGAALLAPFASEATCMLVAHHMDLLRDPAAARAGDVPLTELERLRAYDDQGRRTTAVVPTLERALGMLLEPGVAEAWLSDVHHAEG
ncbi:MAG: HD domain-containing protein [Myxococcota bacterium]